MPGKLWLRSLKLQRFCCFESNHGNQFCCSDLLRVIVADIRLKNRKKTCCNDSWWSMYIYVDRRKNKNRSVSDLGWPVLIWKKKHKQFLHARASCNFFLDGTPMTPLQELPICSTESREFRNRVIQWDWWIWCWWGSCMNIIGIIQLDDGWPESVEEQGLLLLVWRHHITNNILKMCYRQSRRGLSRQNSRSARQ